ncbi:hypothetical protein LINPERPRIM_LOCUS30009, partial [Linum perenne]
MALKKLGINPTADNPTALVFSRWLIFAALRSTVPTMAALR